MIERVLYSVAVVAAGLSLAIVLGFLLALLHYAIETRVRIPGKDPELGPDEQPVRPETELVLDTINKLLRLERNA